MTGSSRFFIPPEAMLPGDRVLLMQNGQLLVGEQGAWWSAEMTFDLLAGGGRPLLISQEPNTRYLVLELAADATPALPVTPQSLRQVLFDQDEDLFRLAGLGNQLLNWTATHRYCGACGQPTEPHPAERALVCGACELHFYPRINPCVIVLVIRGRQILLARHARARGGFYSCLAGFVEAGETPEQTIVREVREEVGIGVHNIRYIRSQSWPFPSQLMLGFFADYADGEIQVDGVEIEHADWFGPEQFPDTPLARISVAGQLIATFKSELYGTGDTETMENSQAGHRP
ncbi:MAG: hypothetical protein RLZZ385_2015 [Pseudomonadota bacterium]